MFYSSIQNFVNESNSREIRQKKEQENEKLKKDLEEAKKQLEDVKKQYTNLKTKDDQFNDIEDTTAGSSKSFEM